MPTLIRTLPLIALLSMGTTLWAQDSTASDDATPTTQTDPATAGTTAGGDGTAADGTQADGAGTEGDPAKDELDMGREVAEDPSYIKDQFGDWQLQCFRSEAGEDPCQMYQLLRESEGNPVAEFTVFKLPGNNQAVAGATIAVPLGTLLPEGIKIAIDGGKAKGYNYSFCSISGCFARIGFTQADIDAFKAGVMATLTIVPAQAPDQTVVIEVSLNGFTAAFNEVSVATN